MQNLLHPLTQLPAILQAIIIGLTILGLWWGSEKVIWSVKNFARYFRVPELLVGLTVVSIGSSFPEIFINISAGLEGIDDIGVGNIVGSCFVQISFIIGICVLIGGTMTERKKKLKRDAPMLLGAIALLFLWSLDGKISAGEALISMGIYLAYIIYLFRTADRLEKLHTKKPKSNKIVWSLAFLIGGFVVWFSAQTLLEIGVTAGHTLGIDESIIGMLSGMGTAIPELSISLMALLRKSNGISVGNLLGSNITDPLFSLSIGAIVGNGFTVSNFLLYTAIPLWFLVTVIVIGIFWHFEKITRLPAAFLIAFYVGSFWWFLA